jgi:hypothetical protein
MQQIKASPLALFNFLNWTSGWTPSTRKITLTWWPQEAGDETSSCGGFA